MTNRRDRGPASQVQQAQELRQAKQTLEGSAENLCNYLSPQIYPSIFIGGVLAVDRIQRRRVIRRERERARERELEQAHEIERNLGEDVGAVEIVPQVPKNAQIDLVSTSHRLG